MINQIKIVTEIWTFSVQLLFQESVKWHEVNKEHSVSCNRKGTEKGFWEKELLDSLLSHLIINQQYNIIMTDDTCQYLFFANKSKENKHGNF